MKTSEATMKHFQFYGNNLLFGERPYTDGIKFPRWTVFERYCYEVSWAVCMSTAGNYFHALLFNRKNVSETVLLFFSKVYFQEIGGTF